MGGEPRDAAGTGGEGTPRGKSRGRKKVNIVSAAGPCVRYD